MTRLLIVNADDYGLTEAVSRGILKAHRQGVVTSTSVLAVGPALAATAGWLNDAPGLGIGVHLAAVGEDPPLLSAREIPSLVDRRGRLPRSWRGFLLRAAAGRIDPADLLREFSAQAQRLVALRLPLTHLDTHQHLHLWPLVGDVVIEVALRFGLSAIRVPRSSGLRWPGLLVNRLARALMASATAAGLRFPSLFWGFDEAGRLKAADVLRAVGRLAREPGSSGELCAHPGESDEAGRRKYAWGEQWQHELALLVDPQLRRAIEARGVRLATFASLARAESTGSDLGGGLR